MPRPNPRPNPGKPIIRVAEPMVGEPEAQRVAAVVASTLVSSVSPEVTEFEARLAKLCGTKHAIAMTCGTHSLDMLMYAFDLRAGDEILMPALTFISVGATVARAGLKPVFVDVDRRTLLSEADAFEPYITTRTRGIIAVHTYGHPCDMPSIMALAKRHGLFVIEDACEALGGSYGGAPVGGLGDVAVHSFYSNKMMTTGNGGAITTDDDALASLVRELRGYSYAPERFFWHEHMPFNMRMSGLQAAIGVAQLDRIPTLVAHHLWLADAYASRLGEVEGVILPSPSMGGQHVYWMYTIHIDETLYGADAHALRTALADEGVETRPVFTPLHAQPVLAEAAGRQGPFPQAEWAAQTGINLPSGATLTQGQIDRVCDVICR